MSTNIKINLFKKFYYFLIIKKKFSYYINNFKIFKIYF